MTTPTTNGITPVRIHHPATVDLPTTDLPTRPLPVEPSIIDSPQPTPETTVQDAAASDTTTPNTTHPEEATPETTPETSAPDRPRRTHKPWPLLIIGAAAAVAVWSGWVGLGQLAGFGVIHPLPGILDDFTINTAVVLPLSVEAYAAYALRVWLGTDTHNTRTLRFAKRSAIASMLIGAVAQIAYHLMSAAGYTHAPWPVVTLVATVPVVVLGLASALAKLVTSDQDK